MYKRTEELEDELYSKPTIISLADVALCLLVIVLSTGAAATQIASVSLPDAQNVVARDVNLSVTLTVTRDGKYYFEDGATPIAAKNLWAGLKAIKGDSLWSTVVVRADKKTPYEHIELVTQCLASLGVEEITYAMKERGG